MTFAQIENIKDLKVLLSDPVRSGGQSLSPNPTPLTAEYYTRYHCKTNYLPAVLAK